ncbi:MAG: response regulator [Acidobacteriia bacterium]|nr:response regulator [Terriglobia bacterium]
MKRILIVDDDPVSRHFLTKILESERYSVASAADGAAGLEQLRTKQVDLALVDVWMPRMTGLELLSHMRNEGIGTKAVIMTSDDTPETLLQAIREQAYQYLSKPVDPDQLVNLVADALSASPVPPIEVLSAKPHWVELLVPCEMAAAERIQEFMSRLQSTLPDDVRDSVAQVFREMLSNAIEWGGQLDPNRKVRISYVHARRMVLYRIADPGPGFKFEELSHAAVAYSPGDLTHTVVRQDKGIRPGGFGILMAKQMVDELLYNEAQNEVMFVKYLD